MSERDREALRQQILLRSLLGDARPGVLAGWTRDGERFARGLAAYRANAGALAERALAAAYPTVAELIGAESFAGFARAYWHHAPPQRGDIAEWGATLPGFIAEQEALAEETYLSDVARLDWSVHRAERAADFDAPPTGLERLAEADPSRVTLELAPGTAIVASAHPIVSIWLAHRSHDQNRFAPVRAAFAEERAETAFVRRAGWRAEVSAIDGATARLLAALLNRKSLAAALAAAGDTFDFSHWLVGALRARLVVAAHPHPGD